MYCRGFLLSAWQVATFRTLRQLPLILYLGCMLLLGTGLLMRYAYASAGLVHIDYFPKSMWDVTPTKVIFLTGMVVLILLVALVKFLFIRGVSSEPTREIAIKVLRYAVLEFVIWTVSFQTGFITLFAPLLILAINIRLLSSLRSDLLRTSTYSYYILLTLFFVFAMLLEPLPLFFSGVFEVFCAMP